MDITQAIKQLKAQPGFTEKVGMVLAHNGVVRGRPRSGTGQVTRLDVEVDQDKVRAICRELSARPGVFSVTAEALSGTFVPGDDLLFIVVAGDIRETVAPILVEALGRIKSEAITKREHLAQG